MVKFIIHRVLLVIPVLAGVIIIVFTINFFSTTNPAMVKLGLYSTDPERLAAEEHKMGLDRPYIIQLGDYVWGVLHGDLGKSYNNNQSVSELIAGRFFNTFRMAVGAVIVSILIGIPLGLIAALKQNTAVDYVTTTFAIFMNAMPSFLVAVVLMLVFAMKLHWFPISGADTMKGLVLPIIAAGMPLITQNARMTRSAVLEVIRQDYVRTARAKGISERVVILRHVLKNALIPILTLVGTSFGMCLSGSILVEMIFNIPGMGMLISSSIMAKDFIIVQGAVLVCAVIVTVMNLLTDLAYAAVDPRIKAQYTSAAQKKKRTAAAEAA